MWSFHFAVEFLCAGEAAPLSHLNQQQKSGKAEVGGESEREGRHFGADTSRTERAAEAYGDLTCEWDLDKVIPYLSMENRETSAVVGVTVAYLEALCTC